MKLRHKLTIAIIATSSILAISILSVVIYWEAENSKEKIQDMFKIQNSFLAREFDRYTFERGGDIESVSFQIANLLEHKEDQLIENVLVNTRNAYKGYQNLFFLDKNYIKRFDTNKLLIGEISHYPFFEQARNKKGTIFDFHKDQDSQKDVISFAHSVKDKKGNFLGIIGANVSRDSIAALSRSIFGSIFVKLKEDVEIIQPDGTILFSNYRGPAKDINFIKFIKSHSREIELNRFIDNGDFYWSITKVRTNLSSLDYGEIYFVIRAQKEEIITDLHRLYKTIFGIFIFITSILTFIGFVIANSISRPIEETSLAISKLGEGDFDALNSIKTTNDDCGILVGHIKDMTKKLNAVMADQTNKSRMASIGEMAGGIAHEINNPLHLIAAHAHMLRRHHGQPEMDHVKIERSLKAITETVERIAKIIKGLKNLSRNGSSDPFTSGRLDLIIENTFSICSEKLKTNGIFIQTIKSEEDIVFDCRSVQISQVLLNLINNACDAIAESEEKWIRIEFLKQEKRLDIKVTNSGEKISEKIIQKLFTPFFTTKADGVGTGLGLSISMAIIHSHKGVIHVDSESDHTCFVIMLPLYQENTQTPPSAASA